MRLLPQHSRYEFRPLPEREPYAWPLGKRLAFTVTTNIEWFAFGAGRLVRRRRLRDRSDARPPEGARLSLPDGLADGRPARVAAYALVFHSGSDAIAEAKLPFRFTAVEVQAGLTLDLWGYAPQP